MFSKTTLGATVGLATGLIGFCIYYDQKRTNDPKYKENVEKKRITKRLGMESSLEIPQIGNDEEIPQLFAQHMRDADEYLNSGDIDKGLEELSIAVLLSGRIKEMIKQLDELLSSDIMKELKKRLPIVAQKMYGNLSQQMAFN